MHLDRSAIEALGKRNRAALINSIAGFRAAVLVGTVDAQGRSNLAIMSTLVHVGSNPPLLALLIRPDTVERHTLENIRATGVYTVNHVHDSFVAEAHQTSARYPREESEFAAVGLEEAWDTRFPAPFVAPARVRLGMALREEHHLTINGTHLLIGEVLSLYCPDESLTPEGSLDPARAGSIAVAGLDAYYRATCRERFAYARTDRTPARLAREHCGSQKSDA